MSDQRKLVLITGAAGMIGRPLQGFLRERYRLRLMYHRTVLPAQPGDEVVIADVCDLAAVEQAVAGVDAIVHLAGDPRVDAPWESVRAVNIAGTYNVFEAARRQGVKKIVFASTNHVAGYYELEGLYAAPTYPIRPDGYYGVSKAFGEALARYYVDAFGLSIICLRIGSFQERPLNRRHLATWISPRDMAQLVWRSIETDLPFGIFYGVSNNTRRYWDIASAQELLGYAPEDNAEDYAAQLPPE